MADPMRKADRYYTYRDYLKWPEEERWELIGGEAWNMSPAPGRLHQKVSFELARQIGNWLTERDKCQAFTAPFDVLLPESDEEEDEASISNVVQPDISVICDPDKLGERGCKGAPDWIIEIVSPFTAMKDFDYKRHLYEQHGVREYWIVDPGNRFVHVYLLNRLAVRQKGEPDKTGLFYEDPIVYEVTPKMVVSREGNGTNIPCTVLEGLAIDLREVVGRD